VLVPWHHFDPEEEVLAEPIAGHGTKDEARGSIVYQRCVSCRIDAQTQPPLSPHQQIHTIKASCWLSAVLRPLPMPYESRLTVMIHAPHDP